MLHCEVVIITLYEVPSRMTPTLEQFVQVTAEEVERLIGNAPCKTCQLDPVPTWLVKEMRALADLAIFVAVVRQVSDFWLLPYSVQESSGTSTA